MKTPREKLLEFRILDYGLVRAYDGKCATQPGLPRGADCGTRRTGAVFDLVRVCDGRNRARW